MSVELQDITAAAARIAPHIIRTPLLLNERMSDGLGCRLYLKPECLQHGAAFKTRGATNAVLALSEARARQGVVTHSSGNHAAALARAAKIRDIPAHVVMPRNSAANKIAAVRRFGVEPIFCEPTAESRVAAAEALRKETGATLIHPYDDPSVIAGQGTLGLELLEQLAGLDTVLVPVGGGGLLAGVLTAIKSSVPTIQVIAIEPEWADDAYRSLQSGRIEMPTRYDTLADGLRTPLGEHTFPIIRQLLDDIILVSEDAISAAMRQLAEEAKLVVEPSGAVGLAGLNTQPGRFAGRSVAVVLTGGNVDVP